MAGSSDYFWNAGENHAAVEKGASASFSTARMVQSSDGYGGTNWEFTASGLVVHVHFQGVSRRVSVVRIKTCDGANYDSNIIKLHSSVSKGVNLKTLAYYCKNSYPNHATFLGKLHAAMPPSAH